MRETLKGNDVEAIKTAYTELQNKFQSVSEELYKTAAASGAGGPTPPPPPGPESAGKKPEGDVVDAEFEVVDDDKKK